MAIDRKHKAFRFNKVMPIDANNLNFEQAVVRFLVLLHTKGKKITNTSREEFLYPEDLVDRIRIKRLHGIDRTSWDRYISRSACWEYEIVENGYKYNMTDLSASIGRVQLKKAKQLLARRRQIADAYFEKLRDCDFLTLPAYSEDHAWHLFIIRLVSQRLAITRNEFISKLMDMGIGTSVHFIPLHIMPYYRKRYGYQTEDFPVAYGNYNYSISLPIYPDLKPEDVNRIVESIKKIGYSARKKQYVAQS